MFAHTHTKLLFLGIAAVLAVTPQLVFPQINRGVPVDATVLETRPVNDSRKLVLWMVKPEIHHSDLGTSGFYACPDQTRGSYYTGKLFVTLVNGRTGQPINTISVRGEGNGTAEEIDIPFLILPGYYYNVSGRDKNVEGKPEIMHLSDYNGDGKALEFALFDKEACQGLATTLIGYSEHQDRVIQYPIVTKTPDGTQTEYWADYLFFEKPTAPGTWSYQIDYRGRGGTLDRFEGSYDPPAETFHLQITRNP